MFTVFSQAMTEDYKADAVPLSEWKFQINNGNTGEVIISDPLLDTFGAATERATSEFLKSSYRLREVKFSTYRTDLSLNDTINIVGLPYLVKSISTIINSKEIKTTVRCLRYE